MLQSSGHLATERPYILNFSLKKIRVNNRYGDENSNISLSKPVLTINSISWGELRYIAKIKNIVKNKYIYKNFNLLNNFLLNRIIKAKNKLNKI